MQQPSAQGIASLYRGNPQPLQQSIQKDQQAKPGLPPDLQKMLALQIVTNEKDGATAQAAMDQLKQMAGPQGSPPTVMQSLQEQAKQKLQAQAVQGQQQQQGIQALMQQAPAGAVPAGTPQPEAQPEAQGIDQLPAEFAMAEGGIVAFSGEDGSDVPEADDSEGIKKALKFVAGLPIEALKTLVSAPGYGLNKDAAPEKKPQPKEADSRAALNKADAAAYAAPAEPKPPAAPARDLKALVAQRAAPAQAAAPAPAPATDSDALKLIKERMQESPEARESREIAKYKAAIGEPDTSQHDRLIEELDKRKAQFEAPKAGYDRLAEYLGEVAKGGRGKKWYEAGAAGSASLNELDKSRKTQQFELSKQAVEVSQKKLDTVRAYAKDVYGVGKSAFDQVYKDQYDAAKEVAKSEQDARKLAQENTLKRLEMQNDLQKANIMANARDTGGTGDRQQLAELKALQKQYADQMKTTFNKADKAALQTKLSAVETAIAKMAGLDTMLKAPGAASPGGTNQQGWGIKPLQ